MFFKDYVKKNMKSKLQIITYSMLSIPFILISSSLLYLLLDKVYDKFFKVKKSEFLEDSSSDFVFNWGGETVDIGTLTILGFLFLVILASISLIYFIKLLRALKKRRGING